MPDYIFFFFFGLAFSDAKYRGAFTGNLDNNQINDLKAIVYNYIQSIIGGTCNEATTNEAIDNIVNYFDDYNNEQEQTQRRFKFGNAQKLVNMTAKYVYIATYDRADLRNHFENCHCPIDSKITKKIIDLLNEYKAISEATRNQINDLFNSYKREQRINRQSLPTMLKNMAFSKITSDEYSLCQDIIRLIVLDDDEIESPLEFDYKYWQFNFNE